MKRKCNKGKKKNKLRKKGNKLNEGRGKIINKKFSKKFF